VNYPPDALEPDLLKKFSEKFHFALAFFTTVE
jgi:hypothetical protein